MPDILIRMEMPKSCVDCHDADLPTAIAWLGAKCPWAHGIIDPGVYDLRHGRHPDCPLHELPPHGDLIDIRTVLEIVMQYVPDDDGSCSKANADLRELLDAIENVPAVIPAERSDTDA